MPLQLFHEKDIACQQLLIWWTAVCYDWSLLGRFELTFYDHTRHPLFLVKYKYPGYPRLQFHLLPTFFKYFFCKLVHVMNVAWNKNGDIYLVSTIHFWNDLHRYGTLIVNRLKSQITRKSLEHSRSKLFKSSIWRYI